MGRSRISKRDVGIQLFEARYMCSLCDYETKSTTGLKLHYRSSHGIKVESIVGNVMTKCSGCGTETREGGKLQGIKHAIGCNKMR